MSLLHIATTPDKGRGVFVKCDVPAGALLEKAPVIPFKAHEWQGCAVGDYAFAWDTEDYSEAIAFGLVSLCNHSADPTGRIECNYAGRTISLFARMDLHKDQEITFAYGCVWFSVKE